MNPTTAKPKKSVVVLIAEDDEDDFMLAKDVFQECCPHVDLRWVRDGEELMDYLMHRGKFTGSSEVSQRPALILLDLNMPKKDGREVLKEIKSQQDLRRIPVVVLTTSNAEADIVYSYDLGVNSFIRKPIGFTQFVDVMKVFDRYWFDIVRLPSTAN
jgi:CheY-like chemotaxis protein